MSTCTIIIKIKDYFPKIDSIPYQNFICLFTSGENEGQIPLISGDNEGYQHQIKNIVSDIKYKVHVLDYNDMSLIGMCEMTISYSIINQISPPNGFIQEQQKKLLMDLNTKRKLFGTVTNMGDIYLNIYSEIYLSEKNNNISMISQNSKSTSTRKKNFISNNSELRRKFDGSPRTQHKKRLIMEMNSDRQAIMNLNKNNNLNKKIENKQNSSFKSNILKNKTKTSINSKKSLEKRYINNNNNKEKENNLSHNIINRFKTESNKNNNIKKNKLINKENKNEKILKGGVNYFSNQPNNNLLINNVSPKICHDENEELQFNNTGNKITTIESLENIDFSGKKYITKAKTKKTNSQNNVNSNINNTLFSTNSTEQEINDIDKIILEKGTEIRNDFNSHLNNQNNNDSLSNHSIEENQLEIKNTIIKLIDFYSLLSHKLFKINKKNIYLSKKNNIYKEKLFTELKKNNILTQKKTIAEVENFININNHSNLNEKFLRGIIKLKKAEFKIFQNIFNLFYYEYDILKYKEYEKNKKMDEGVKVELLLVVFKNLLKNYGNISQIYLSDINKKNILINCLNKYGLNEKIENDGNNNIEIIQMNNKNNNNNSENKDNKNDLDKFKVIKEVDEEKEDEIDDEEERYNNNNIAYNNNLIDNNQISYSNSNIKDNNLYSNEKSESKSFRIKSDQKKLFLNEEKISNNDNKKDLDIIKDNLNEKIDKDISGNKNSIINEINNIKNNIVNNNIIESNENESKEKKENGKNESKESENKLENNDKIDKNEINNENIKEVNINIKDDVDNENIEENDKNEIDRDLNHDNLSKNKDENGDNKEEKSLKIETNEINNKKEAMNEIMKDDLVSEKEEINNNIEKKNNNKINNYPLSNDVYIKKNRIKDNNIDKQDSNNIEIGNKGENNINNNNKEVYKRKNRFRKREEKESYDKEDLKMQKLLIEEFPKKCKEENRFIRLTKYEYSFGEEKIRVELGDDDVILKLDEGDYKLDEFIAILNEGKEEEEEKERNIVEDREDKKSSNKKNEYELSDNSEKKGKRKRRKKRVSEENSEEDENEENDNEKRKEEEEEEEEYNLNGKENEEEDNEEINENKEKSDINKYEVDYSDEKNKNYYMKRRKDYLLKK